MLGVRQAYQKKKRDDFINVNIEVRDTGQLYEGYGYRNSEYKTLNRELERYILANVSCYELKKNLRLIINVMANNGRNKADISETDIHSHFFIREEEAKQELEQLVKQWRINMLIGILFLVLCLILVEIFAPFSYINVIKIIKESLMIIGWVALWEPVTFLLFGWRALKRRNLYYRKLCCIPVIVNDFTNVAKGMEKI